VRVNETFSHINSLGKHMDKGQEAKHTFIQKATDREMTVVHVSMTDTCNFRTDFSFCFRSPRFKVSPFHFKRSSYNRFQSSNSSTSIYNYEDTTIVTSLRVGRSGGQGASSWNRKMNCRRMENKFPFRFISVRPSLTVPTLIDNYLSNLVCLIYN
jgi:hypothetical protein